MLQYWQSRARELRRDIYALYFACRDPRTPWYTKLMAALVVGYAFSPIDLIPDFIPVLGYLDDLLIVPLGVLLVGWQVPSEVMADSRRSAEEKIQAGKPVVWIAAVAIVMLWIILAVICYQLLRSCLQQALPAKPNFQDQLPKRIS